MKSDFFLKSDQIFYLKSDQIFSLKSDQISFLKSDQIFYLKSAQIFYLKSDQIFSLKSTMIRDELRPNNLTIMADVLSLRTLRRLDDLLKIYGQIMTVSAS